MACPSRTTLAGMYGRVKWPGKYTSHAFEWSMDIEADLYEDTAWEYDGSDNPIEGTGADGWRTYIPGLKGFSGSYSCYQDEVPADFAPDTVGELELWVDRRTGARWVGCAVMSAIHPSAPIDGMQTVDVDFEGVLDLEIQTGT